jgi:hypothetical protein
MKITLPSCAALSVILASLLCSCGKKDESPPAGKPQSEPAAALPATPQASQQPAPAAPAKTPEPAEVGGEKSFNGTIGGQPVVMQLSMKEGAAGSMTVTGSYFLESQGSSNKVSLSGSLMDGNLVMDQLVQGAVTGTFDLTNDQANKSVYLGSWKSQGRVLPVKLTAAR